VVAKDIFLRLFIKNAFSFIIAIAHNFNQY
jgi:hypothetical protein